MESESLPSLAHTRLACIHRIEQVAICEHTKSVVVVSAPSRSIPLSLPLPLALVVVITPAHDMLHTTTSANPLSLRRLHNIQLL